MNYLLIYNNRQLKVRNSIFYRISVLPLPSVFKRYHGSKSTKELVNKAAQTNLSLKPVSSHLGGSASNISTNSTSLEGKPSSGSTIPNSSGIEQTCSVPSMVNGNSPSISQQALNTNLPAGSHGIFSGLIHAWKGSITSTSSTTENSFPTSKDSHLPNSLPTSSHTENSLPFDSSPKLGAPMNTASSDGAPKFRVRRSKYTGSDNPTTAAKHDKTHAQVVHVESNKTVGILTSTKGNKLPKEATITKVDPVKLDGTFTPEVDPITKKPLLDEDGNTIPSLTKGGQNFVTFVNPRIWSDEADCVARYSNPKDQEYVDKHEKTLEDAVKKSGVLDKPTIFVTIPKDTPADDDE